MKTAHSALSVSDLLPGSHVYWLAESGAPAEDDLHTLLAHSIESNQAVVYLYHFRDPRRTLIAEFPHLETAINSGQIRFHSALEIFLPNSTLDLEQALANLKALLKRSAQGRNSLLVISEMTWVFEAALGAERITEFERRVRLAIQDQVWIVVAKYDRQYFKPAVLLDLLSSYRQVMVKGELYENFYFVPPHHSLVEQHQAAVLHQSIETLRALGRIENLLEERSTQLKQSESALEMLHSIIDSMGDGVFVVDEFAQMIFSNKSAEAILGYGLLSLPFEERVRKIGNYLPDGVTPYPVHDLPIARAVRGESTDNQEYIIRNDRRPNGVWVNANGRPLRDKEGSIKGGLVVFRDVTRQRHEQLERERLEEQMFRTQKLESLGVLAGGIAHDFNNLLMGVLGNADLALKELTAGTEEFERVGQITTAARRLADLTNQLLAYSGQGPFAEESVSLSALVTEMAQLLRPAISKRTKLQYELMPDIAPILVDGTQIRQIVMNLITNASDAIGEREGSIIVTTSQLNATADDLKLTYVADELAPGQYVVLDITDSGCGMDEATLARIFDPFFTTKFTGRGLGLAAVLGIVRRHRGALQVQSAPGKGTRFRVLFPADEEVSHAPRLIATVKNGWRGSGKILVVDDEDAVRDIAAEMLRHLGFEALVAESGKQALALVESHRKDLRAALLDLTMPDMDGRDLLARIRERDSKLRVILSSGYHESDTFQRFDRSEVSGYLQKPYGHAQLQAVIQRALAAEA